jgi:hypothetical protein
VRVLPSDTVPARSGEVRKVLGGQNPSAVSCVRSSNKEETLLDASSRSWPCIGRRRASTPESRLGSQPIRRQQRPRGACARGTRSRSLDRTRDASGSERRLPRRHGQNERGLVVGRKAWMLGGSDTHAEAAAAIFSVIASCPSSPRSISVPRGDPAGAAVTGRETGTSSSRRSTGTRRAVGSDPTSSLAHFPRSRYRRRLETRSRSARRRSCTRCGSMSAYG